MNYFLGIDIGGTKSHALIADSQGNAIGIGTAGTGNQEVIGYDGLRTVLHQITSAALNSANLQISQIQALGLGIAGYDWPQDYAPHHEAIASLGISPFAFVNDAVIGLIAGSSTVLCVHSLRFDRLAQIERYEAEQLLIGHLGEHRLAAALEAARFEAREARRARRGRRFLRLRLGFRFSGKQRQRGAQA